MPNNPIDNVPFEDLLSQSNFHFPGKPTLTTFAEQGTAPSVNVNIDPRAAMDALKNKVDGIPDSPMSGTSLETLNPAQVDVSGRYPTQRIGGDNEDLYGKGQTWGAQAVNGILKGVATAGTTFLQGTLGLAYGLEQVVTGNGAHSFYDNDFSNALNNFNTGLENTLPNYYTAKERNAKWWEASNLFTSNFIWDKLVKNAGFSIGAIYSGNLIAKGIQSLTALVPAWNMAKAAEAANVMEQNLSIIPETQRLSKFQDIIKLASDKFNSSAKGFMQGGGAERLLTSTFGAATEGGLEALQGVNDWRNKTIQDYTVKNGYAPIGEDLDKINNFATKLGNDRFGLNMALLTATNYVMLPKILGSSVKDSKMIANTLAAEGGETGAMRTLADGTIERALPTSRLGKALYKTSNIATLLFSPAESFEELSQYAFQRGVENYYDKQYNGKGADWLNEIGNGYYNALTEKEGLESAFLGGVSGALQESGIHTGFKTGNYAERGFTGYGGHREAAALTMMDKINSTKATLKSDKWLADTAAAAKRGINLIQEGDALVRQGDTLEIKDNEADQAINYLGNRIKYGRYDLVKDDIGRFRNANTTAEGLQKLKDEGYAAPSDTQESFTQRLNNFERHADNINSLYNSLNLRYGGKKSQYTEDVIDKMVYAASKVSDYDQRIPELNKELAQYNIPVQDAVTSAVMQSTSGESTKAALDAINNLVQDRRGNTVTSDTKDQLKSDLRDIMELSVRRKEFLKEYESIKSNPNQYNEALLPKRTENVILPEGGKSTKYTNVDDYELGREYSLAQPIRREGNSIILAPKVTPLSSTLGTEVETTLPTGETKFIPKEDFKTLPITEESNDSEEVNSIFKNSVNKIVGRQQFAHLRNGYNTIDKTNTQAIQDFVNEQNDSELADAIVRDMKPKIKDIQDRIKKAAADLAKLQADEKLRKSLDEQQGKTDNQTGIVNQDDKSEEELKSEDKNNDYKKAPIEAFLSKEADFYDKKNPKPHQKRRLVFLTNLASIANTKKAASIKVMTITPKNEAKYGLKGFHQWMIDDIKATAMEPEQRAKYFNPDGTIKADQQPIIKLYVANTSKGLRAVDMNGDVIENPGGDNTLESIIEDGIFGRFHSQLSGAYEFGENTGQQNYLGDPSDLPRAQAQFQAWRTKTLESDVAQVYDIRGISRGIVLRDDVNKPVTQTALVKAEDLSKEGLVRIPTKEGDITVNNIGMNFPVGQPLLVNGSNVDFLNNRKFSPEEADKIFKLFRNLAISVHNSPFVARTQAYLSSVLYMRKTANPALSQVFLDGTSYNFGGQFSVPLTENAFNQNEQKIKDFFQNYFIKVNNKYLNTNPYEEAYIKSDGQTGFRAMPSYQEYLLSDKLNPTPILQTKAIKQISPEDPTIISRYTTLQSNEFNFEATPIVRVAKQSTPKAQAGGEEGFIPFGETIETEDEPAFGAGFSFKKEEQKPVVIAQELKNDPLFGNRAAPTAAQIAEIERQAKEKRDKMMKNPFSDEWKIENPVVEYKPIDIQKELGYIQAKTPFNVEILDNIIKTPDGLNAWGAYKQMGIRLYKYAQEGTGYHEVFEGVWKQFTSDKEKENITKDFKSRKGNFTFFDGTNYYSVPYKEATQNQMKETLADEFSDFVKTGESPEGFSIRRWFTNLWDFLKSIFTGRVENIDQLFKNIDASKYRSMQYSPSSVTDNEEYKLQDVNYQQQYETIRGVAIQVMQNMLNPNNPKSVSLTEFEESTVDTEQYFDGVYRYLDNVYNNVDQVTDNPEQQKAYKQYWLNIQSDWENVKKLTKEYLNTYSIIESFSDNSTRSNVDYIDDRKYFMNDAKNTASRSIRLLIATIPESKFDNTGKAVSYRNSTLMQEQVQYAKEFNSLLWQLSDINGFDQKMGKLEELAKKLPNFDKLFTRLISKSNVNNPNSVLNDWKLKVRFFSVMSKQIPTAYIQFNAGDKSSSTSTLNLSNSVRSITQSWLDGLKNDAIEGNSQYATTLEDGSMVLITKNLNDKITTPQDRMTWLNKLNIPFTVDMFNKLSGPQQTQFNDAVAGLKKQLTSSAIFPLSDSKGLRSAGNLNTLAISYINAGNNFESTYYNMEGEQQTTAVQTNKISRDINDINSVETKAELLEIMPQLAQVQDSIYLNSILFDANGRRKNLQLHMGFIQGTMDSRGKPVPGDSLSINQRLVQETNQNLNGRYYVMVPADSKTQWMMELTNTIPYKTVVTGANDWRTRAVELFTEYYNTEKAAFIAMGDNAKGKAGIFREMSKEYTLSDTDFHFAVNDFIEQKILEQRKFMETYKILTTSSGGKFQWEGLDSGFTSREGLNHQSLTTEDIDNILRFRTVNYMINNTEMQKIFFGNILEYKDPTKRYKLFLSPREISMSGNQDFNDYLNKEMNNRIGTLKLDHPYLGQHISSDFMPTVTMNDIFSVNDELAKIAPAYKDTNTTDASAISTLIGMRERRLKGGNWTEDDEKQFQFSMARDRQLMLKDGYLNDKIYGNKLQEHDRKLVEKGNPNSSYIYVEKPILSGHTDVDGTYTPIVDKFSIVSYSYTAVRNTNLRTHYLKMMKQDINYVIVKSGRKVGARTADDFYDDEGSANSAPYKSIINVPFASYGVQSDTSSKKENQTRGTQVTKLAIVNLYDGGVPISELAHSLAQDNISLLKEQTDLGYKKLLKQIGAEDTGQGYKIVDKTRIMNLVRSELLRREVSDSIKAQLSINPQTKDLTTAFEAMPNYQQIKSILYSHVDKAITSPKVNGAPMVQVSGALMEAHGFKRTKKDGVYTAAGLKFYTKDEPWMEVMLPFWAGQQLRKAGLKWDSDSELHSLLSKSPDAIKLLSGVGYRIPTQELNSIEHFRIKGFLPEEMGNTIVVPEEITTKSGSDFDIDKLNTYLQNIYVDPKGVVRIIPYFGIGTEARERVRKFLTENAMGEMFKPLTGTEKIKAFLDIETTIEDDEEVEDKFYRQSIENEYFNNIRDILSLPENFKRLITPNTSSTLTGIRDQLVDINPYEFSSGATNSVIDPMFMLNTRHEGLTAKTLIGIPAVAQTGTAVAQLSPVTLDYEKVKTMKFSQRKYIGNNPAILLPHNTIDNLPTISVRKDQEGVFITDKISQYINGAVDALKDSFLSAINFNRKTASVYLMLERLGVPNSKEHPIVSFFMNQPIIREFIKFSDVKRQPNIMNAQLINAFRMGEGNAKFGMRSISDFTFPQKLGELTSVLRDNIVRVADGTEFTAEQKAEQISIFNEFLKYGVYSNQLFQFQQATNYDTANLNDNYSLAFKNQAFANQAGNVFRSVTRVLDSTFIGSVQEALGGASSALSSVLKINNPITQGKLAPILDRIYGTFTSQDEKIRMARKLEESLINHIIQTEQGINNSLKDYMVDESTAVVKDLRTIKKQLKQSDQIGLINSNLILKQLIPYIRGNNKNTTKNITLAVKPRMVFDKNLYNASFQELLNNPITQPLAEKLVTMSFLQNGISNSPISFKDAIPPATYSAIIQDVIGQITDTEALDRFMDSGAFYRNNWDDEAIVPSISSDDYPLPQKLVASQEFIDILRKNGMYPQEGNTPLTLWYPVFGSAPYMTYNDYREDELTGETFTVKTLFKRVEDENGIGVVRTIQKYSDQQIAEGEDPNETEKRYLYIQTNAWGDSFRANEYYQGPHISVFNNGYQKIVEVDSVQLANYVQRGELPEGIVEEEEPPTPPPPDILLQKDAFESFKENLETRNCK